MQEQETEGRFYAQSHCGQISFSAPSALKPCLFFYEGFVSLNPYVLQFLCNQLSLSVNNQSVSTDDH